MTEGSDSLDGDPTEFYSVEEIEQIYGKNSSAAALAREKAKSSSKRKKSSKRSSSKSTTGSQKSPPRPSSGGGGKSKLFMLPAPEDPHAVIRQLEPKWTQDGVLTTLYWGDCWWRYTNGVYRMFDEAEVISMLRLTTEKAHYLRANPSTGALSPVKWKPTNRKISDLLGAMRTICHPVTADGATAHAGTWRVKEGDEEDGLISMQNGLFNLKTRELTPHSPRYMATHQLSFDFDPRARCPRWKAFLESIWPDDFESKRLLQEWMWYVLSGRTDLEKMMFFKGATRSGKGTITRVIRNMLGENDVAAPTLSSLGSNFGLTSLIGRSLAVIGDARSSSRIDMQQVIARLLSITGRDQLDVDRKNKSIWTGVLPTRVMILSNESPWFRDGSGAITGRMLLLIFKESFLGREDLGLAADLDAELSGIFNWVLKGQTRMKARGWRFTTPRSTEEERKELADEISPLSTFIEEKCVVATGRSVVATELFEAYLKFEGLYDERILERRSEETKFGGLLRKALPKVSRVRRSAGNERPWVYLGIGLRGEKGRVS